VEFFDKKTFMATVNMWMKNRYRTELLDQRSRGACFGTLKANYNFFLGNCKAPVSDALFRFTVRGRNDTLWTLVKRNLYYPKENGNIYCKCNRESPKVESLFHILNCCLPFRGVLMTRRHNRVVKVVVDAITNRFNLNINELWLNLSLRTVEEADNKLGGNFIHINWNDNIARLRPDIAFWKKDSCKGRKTKTLWLLDITVPFGKVQDGRDTLNDKWIKKLLKYKRLTDMVSKCLVNIDGDGYETEVKAGFIVVSSLGVLHQGTRRCFEDMMSLNGRKMDKQGIDLWMKRIVVESLKGSFDLWIKASPRAIGSFEPEETIELMRKKNVELGITQDKRQVRRGGYGPRILALVLHPGLLRG
jgi:hypothetical protein